MSASKKRLIITEDEKRSILNLYGLISEQETRQIFGNSFFGNGIWMELNPKTTNKLDKEIDDAIKFLSENKGQIGSIQITASESQVPNTDNEPKSPDYGKTLPVLELSRRRANTMKQYMMKKFQGALDAGIISQLPEFTEPVLLLGKTKYDVKNPRNPKHDEERYVKVDVSLKAKDEPKDTPPSITPPDCARDMKIRIYYDPKEHGNSHTCNSSVYEVYVNDVLVNRDSDNKPYISLNNSGLLDDAGYTVISQDIPDKSKSKGNKTAYKKVYSPKSKNSGGARSNTITITNELFNSIPDIDKGVNIKFVCRNISKWIPTPSDLINQYDLPGEFFTASTVNGILYHGTQMTYKDGEWFHATNWKFGCHRGVGSIDITNNEGKTVTIPLKTPTEKDESVTYKSIDPCTLKFKE